MPGANKHLQRSEKDFNATYTPVKFHVQVSFLYLGHTGAIKSSEEFPGRWNVRVAPIYSFLVPTGENERQKFVVPRQNVAKLMRQ